MATAGPSFAGTGANSNDGGSVAWSSPTNIQGDTTATAATCNPNGTGNTSQLLRASNFGFSIPSPAVIQGILVEPEVSAANNSRSVWNAVRLLIAGSESGDDRKADGSAPSTTKQFKTFGGASVLWGLTPTAAQINASGFGASFKINQPTGQATTTSVFRVRITVTYLVTANGTLTGTGGGTSAIVKSTARNLGATGTGGGTATVSITTSRTVALAGVGGGTSGVAETTARGLALLGSGGGAGTIDAEATSSESHDGSLTGVGGGSGTITATTSRIGLATGTGGGTAALSAGRTADADLTGVGGGSGTVSVTHNGSVALAGTGGGDADYDISAEHRTSLAGTGGGTADPDISTERDGIVDGAAGGTGDWALSTTRLLGLAGVGGGDGLFEGEPGSNTESHEGTLTGSGGGSGILDSLSERFGVVSGIGGGAGALSAASGRVDSLIGQGGGIGVFRSNVALISEIDALIMAIAPIGNSAIVAAQEALIVDMEAE